MKAIFQLNQFRFLCLLASFCFCLDLLSPQIADAEEDKVSVPFDVQVGDKFEVSIVKERTDIENASVRKHTRLTARYEGQVDNMRGDGLTLSWTPSSINLENLLGPKLNLGKLGFDDLASKFMFATVFETDLFGQPQKIVNRVELQEKMTALFDEIDIKDGGGFKKFMQDNFFSLDDQQFSRFFLQEATLLGQGQSFELPRTGNIEGFEELPSPFGGGTVKSMSRLRFVSENEDEVVFELSASFDPESVKKLVADMMQKMATELKKPLNPAKAALESLDVKADDLITYHVSKADGWTTKIVRDKNTKSVAEGKSLERRDQWEIAVLRE
jgi:hypothetical protein